jgi:hypothetical protein
VKYTVPCVTSIFCICICIFAPIDPPLTPGNVIGTVRLQLRRPDKANRGGAPGTLNYCGPVGHSYVDQGYTFPQLPCMFVDSYDAQ